MWAEDGDMHSPYMRWLLSVQPKRTPVKLDLQAFDFEAAQRRAEMVFAGWTCLALLVLVALLLLAVAR